MVRLVSGLKKGIATSLTLAESSIMALENQNQRFVKKESASFWFCE